MWFIGQNFEYISIKQDVAYCGSLLLKCHAYLKLIKKELILQQNLFIKKKTGHLRVPTPDIQDVR